MIGSPSPRPSASTSSSSPSAITDPCLACWPECRPLPYLTTTLGNPTNTVGHTEVAGVAPAVAVRDSKDPDGPKLILDAGAWRALTRRIKAG
ncbi:DUF397 domain-containing protein [Actinomadura sp. 1N219]|uniref:DUF397 domain-containing protein n=1 Tax=Actinomadura sp. 1N219 TaxID=3375152 RepID=UPI003799842A